MRVEQIAYAQKAAGQYRVTYQHEAGLASEVVILVADQIKMAFQLFHTATDEEAFELALKYQTKNPAKRLIEFSRI